jgi:2-amino-4-hydroxy-6-hydroxymethyldihydropteridine diphosphokinase
MQHTIYLGLGTNLGDLPANFDHALQALSPQVVVTARSPIYETPPWGYLDQPSFLNQAVKAETDLSPGDLIAFLKRLEHELGRVQGLKNGPRLIDLDLLFYDDLSLELPDLTIPHPRIEGRGFILTPLADLAPDLRHPVLGKTIAEMLAESDTTGIKPFAPENSNI